MAVIAGLFDSQSDATEAMDKLLRAGFKDLDSRVIESGSQQDTSGSPGGVVPIIPATGGAFGVGQSGAGVGVPFSGNADWLGDMDKVESAFYQEGLKEGATLAMIKVDDDHADEVRQMLRQFGARTYTKD